MKQTTFDHLNPILTAIGFEWKEHKPFLELPGAEKLGPDGVFSKTVTDRLFVEVSVKDGAFVQVTLMKKGGISEHQVGQIHRWNRLPEAEMLSKVISDLEGIAHDPSSITCPECKKRLLNVWEPHANEAGRKKPFLRCEQSRMTGNKGQRGCWGKSNTTPIIQH